MAGKRAPPAKAAKSTKTRSTAHAAPKAGAGAPKAKRSTKASKGAQKARDADQRDSLNGADDSLALRAALLSRGKPEVVKEIKKPKELDAGGDQLAALLSAGM